MEMWERPRCQIVSWTNGGPLATWLHGAWTNTAERGIAELNEASSAPPPASANFINPETMHPPAQTRQVFDNLRAALEAVGAGFEQVVKLNFYLVDATHLPVIREVRDQYVNTRQPPASTAVEVRRLFREDALIEVEAVAVIAPTEPSGR